MDNRLRQLQQALGYEFRDPALLHLALTHRSAQRSRNNERLEFLGDAQLGKIIANALFHRFPEATEGQLTRMRATLVRGQTLAQVAAALGVGDCLILGSGELKSGGFRRESILADALEALIGAIAIEAGEPVCEQRVLHWFANRLASITPDIAKKDAKTRLQELLQARQNSLPTYVVTHIHGQAPNQSFTVTCSLPVDEAPRFEGKGTSRRKAEQSSADHALAWLEQWYGK